MSYIRSVYTINIVTGNDCSEPPDHQTVGVCSSVAMAQRRIVEDLVRVYPDRRITFTQELLTHLWVKFNQNACPEDKVLVSHDGRAYLASLDMYLIEEFIEDARICG